MSFTDFSSTYQPPGTYIEQTTPQVISVPITLPSYVALVGPASGSLSNTEAIVFPSVNPTTTPVPLGQLNITASSIVITDANNNVFSSSNYTVTQTGAAGNVSTSLELTAASNIPTQTVVYVSYKYTSTAYYEPQTFTSYNQIVSVFGPPMDANNNITSPLTLAAAFAFANGNPTIVIVPTTDTTNATETGLLNAYNNIASNPDIDIVVPLAVGITGNFGTNGGAPSPGEVVTVGTDLANHCTTMSQEGFYRIGIYGSDVGVSFGGSGSSYWGPDSVATSIGSSRVVYAWPNQLQYFNYLNNQVVTVGGQYLAAALAGRLASGPPQNGLTKVNISGFSGIPNSIFSTMTTTYKNQLSSSGVTVLEPTSGGVLQIRQGLTTNMSNVMTREISLVRSTDTMMYELATGVNNSGLIGQPTSADTPGQVQSVVQGILEGLVTAGTIIAYTNLNAAVVQTNPTVVQVTFAYQPAFPLNYVIITFNVDTSTGTLALAA